MKMVKLVIQEIPPSMNIYDGRKNAWQYRKDKRYWKDLIMWTAKSLKPYVTCEKSTVRITYFFPTKVRHDPDNYAGKFILDGLKGAKIITDDNFDCIDLILKGNHDKGNPRTEIVVEEQE